MNVGQQAGQFGINGVGVGLGSDKGEASSTTQSGISGIAGNTAVRTGDQETGIQKIFDAGKVQREIDAQVQIMQAFTKEAPKAAATFAAGQKAGLQAQASAETDPAKRQALLDEAQKWEEGGVYRIALHTLMGGLSGGIGGAAGAAASASAANLMSDLQDGIQQSLIDAGLGADAAKAVAQGVATLTAAMREWQDEIAQFLDQPIEVVQGLEGASPHIREAALLSTYREGIKNALPPQRARYGPRTAYVRVMDKDRERAKYHLVYLTTHPVGIIEFMQISQDVELIQKRVRVAKKAEIRQQQSGMEDMFVDAYDDWAADSEQASPSMVDEFWLRYLSTDPKVVDEDAFADILERQGWTPHDLQSSLARLIKSGQVMNLNASSLRPKRPLHYEKREQLVLTP